jgi:DNA-3-methyladenine glycosylase I
LERSGISATIEGPDGKQRCLWCGTVPELRVYHDSEWGFPVGDDFRLFEKLSLEGFQSGLSWRTILAKRENFRAAFHHFDFNTIAGFDEHNVDRLMMDEGIIRHRGKIKAVISNARLAKKLVEQGDSLAAFVWRFEPDAKPPADLQTVTTSVESIALSTALKKLGWQFIGPTTAYAFMQSMGLINDHAGDCVMRSSVEQARERFTLRHTR